MKEIIIVPQIDKGQEKLHKIFPDEVSHYKEYEKFIIENNIPVDLSSHNAYLYGKNLAYFDYLCLHSENQELLLFIPPMLDKTQYQFMKNHYSSLKKYHTNILLIKYENDNYTEFQYDSYYQPDYLELLKEKVKETYEEANYGYQKVNQRRRNKNQRDFESN